MTEAPSPSSAENPVEAIMREELAHGDVSLGTIALIVGHLLANGSTALFSEETVAQVRGMLHHLARQFLFAEGEATKNADPGSFAADKANGLADHLAHHPELIAHCHARALEWQLTSRLRISNDIDPVLSPQLQAFIASEADDTAKLAMAVMASQARFMQQMQRMDLPLSELAGDLFHQALQNWRSYSNGAESAAIDAAETVLRSGFDERARREALFARLVGEMGSNAAALLDIAHSGAALFFSALALATGHSRDLALQSAQERQMARLALSLRSAGLKSAEVENQFVYIHPEIILPDGFESLRADRAAQLLAESSVKIAE